MVNRLATAVLLALLAAVHAQLWLGRGSLPRVNEMQRQIEARRIAQMQRIAEQRRMEEASRGGPQRFDGMRHPHARGPFVAIGAERAPRWGGRR